MDQAERLRQLAKGNDSVRPVVITVTSGKGGVGKSNVVVNLSITLQKMGKKVLIFDADVGMANDDVLLGFIPKYSVFDIVYKNMEIDDVVQEGPYGVKLLPGGNGITQIEQFTSSERDTFINKLTNLNGFDYIIMDTGAGINRNILGFIACSEIFVVLTTPEPTALTDAYSLLKVVNYFKIKDNARVIINRVYNSKEGKSTYDRLKSASDNFLKMKLGYLGCVSDDRKLAEAVRMQSPVVVSFPNSDSSKDIYEIANNLLGSSDDVKGIGVTGFFKKLFNIFS